MPLSDANRGVPLLLEQRSARHPACLDERRIEAVEHVLFAKRRH